MSARALPVRQMDKVIRKREGEKTDPKALGPDEMRLYSYYKPGLVAGNYEITATQTVSSPSDWGQQNLVVRNTKVTGNSGEDAPQQFQVVVPRFSLDLDLINSYYPPDGHQDEGRILPHIVLNDPHYPWEILAGMTKNMRTTVDPHTLPDNTTLFRGLVPWIALLVFDPEDLRFTNPADLKALTKEMDLMNQNPKGTFTMRVADYLSLPSSSRIKYEAGYPKGGFDDLKKTVGNVDIIFPKKDLFNDIFASPEDTDGLKPAVEAHKFLAHVRHINTIGFPDAGVEEEGLFSIVVSSRTGKINIDQPHTQVCHLVSIEHVDSTLGKSMAGGSDRIGMVSLFSWVYTALPPNPVSFVDTVKNLV